MSFTCRKLPPVKHRQLKCKHTFTTHCISRALPRSRQDLSCPSNPSYDAAPVAACSRRDALHGALLATGLLSGVTLLVPAARALPLAPLGRVERVGGDKLTGLTAEQVKEILARDLAEGMYFVTGNLTREVFADDCRFIDPTNSVTGLSKYLKALGLLFDPDWSKVVLDRIEVTGPNTIEADWRLAGWLNTKYFPWNPKVEPFQGHTVYTLSEEGLVQSQSQTWSISGLKALQQTFTPVAGPRQQLL